MEGRFYPSIKESGRKALEHVEITGLKKI